MGFDLYDVMVIGAVMFGRSVTLFIWVLVPFSIGYGLPFLASGRKSLNVMWVLAALALILLTWALNARGPFGLANIVLPLFFALAYGLVLACLIRELSLRRNLSTRFSTALTIAGFASMPVIIAGLNASLLWAHREANAACLATNQTVDVAGTRYRLPNVPFVLMPGESNHTADGFINQRLRKRCAAAQDSEAMPIRSGFALDLRYWGQQFQVTQKICADGSAKPRWMVDVCAARNQVLFAKMRETFAATHLPLELAVSEIPRTTERPYTLAQEHLSNLRRRGKHPYRELPGTADFSIYADGEKSHYGETRFWIRKDVAEPEAFACRNIGNNSEPLRHRCKVRYARGASLITHEFETEPGREEDTVAQVNSRIHDILSELAAPP